MPRCWPKPKETDVEWHGVNRKGENIVALYYCKDGFPFIAGPYTEEDRQEFEERLRRGGDITIIRQRKPVHLEPSQDDPER
jgi:hypothetical protein